MSVCAVNRPPILMKKSVFVKQPQGGDLSACVNRHVNTEIIIIITRDV